jgi:hypothetical protein
LAGLPAIFPDGKPFDQTAFPWLLNSIVCRNFKKLMDRSIFAYLKEWITILLSWWVVPITMIGFWIRYLVTLKYADLSNAFNLSVAQLSKVKTLYRAKLDPELLTGVQKCCPQLLEKPENEIN